MKSLFLFTASYPYEETETFLEDEIVFLAQEFERVVIVPLYGEGKSRPVPSNCEVMQPVEKGGVNSYSRLMVPNKATTLFLRDFFKKKVYISGKRFKSWLIAYRQICNLLGNNNVRCIFDNIGKDDVCYSYWGKGAVSLAVLYGRKTHFVSRFHGEWDLWEESSGNYAPVREVIANNLELAAFISHKGESYFKDRYNCSQTTVFPLGSLDNGVGKKSDDGVLRIVSCSSVYPLKRVPLLFEALLCSSLKIEWTHLGGGTQFEELKVLTEEKRREGLSVNLIGQISHEDVIAYYKSHKTDLFVNLSTNEGVPVSIMEAISFNIPVLATNVGATSEVVSELSGVLIGANPSPLEIAMAIEDIMKRKDSLKPRVFWNTNFNAEVNYKAFAKKIANL